ncbi:MAG: DUF1295 domain-containing protein [Bacteroidia bacterium]|nr:DUF1295 domain-containing protein [Bacteroidia bacterium]
MTDSVLNSIIIGWMLVAVISFFYLLRKPAPYGRYAAPGWGRQMDARVGWIIMESPALAVMLAYLLYYFRTLDDMTLWLMLLYIGHYTYRALIYPFRLRNTVKKTSAVVVGSAVFFNLVNANLLGYSFTYVADYPPDIGFETSFQTGAMLFFVGIWFNIKSDNRLIRLRKESPQAYVIPYGWLYRWVSCPNYLGEMIEWTGFALMAQHLASWSFVVWTVANLLPRALLHHQWYLRTFPDYPERRKAVIPYLL